MPRAYQCRGCKGPPLPKPWPGERCPNCRRFFNWKEVNDTSGTEIVEPVDGEVISFQDAVDTRVEVPKIETGIAGIDHVLCGGLPPGALILLTGDPGAGKTTLQMQMFQSLAKHRVSTLYISGEEDIPQLADRYHHLGKFPARMQALHETDLDSILYQVTEVKPQVVCLDSIQIVACTSGSGDDLQPGSAASVKIVCRELMQFAKENRVTFVAIGHINADGAISGPKSLIYYVDVVLHLQGGKGEAGRFLRCDDKNRFGKTPRKSRFTMTGDGDAGGGTLVDNYEEDVEAARLAVVAAEQDALNAERKAREKVDDLLDITDGDGDDDDDDDDEPDNVFTLAREARRAEPWVAADGTNEKVVLAVRCGVQDCRGSIGRACTSASGMREAGFHESRVEAARIEAASAPTVAPTPTEVVLAREEEEEKTTAQMPKALKAPPRVRKPRAKKTKPASPPSETPPDAPRSPR